MLQKTAAYMERYQMAQPGEKIVLGLSGGKDSVCLFHVLKKLGYELEAVHINHGIRGEEAERDECFVKALCKENRVPFYAYRFDVPQIAKEKHLSEEEAGRMVRRQAFLEVMKKSGAAHIALAHHGNDRAETFLFHLIRGTGVKGLASMKPVEGVWIRPLLWASREEIEVYVEHAGNVYVEDSTNAATDYTRNKIRHRILPLLEGINPKSVIHICKAAEKLSEVSAYIDREAEKYCEIAAEKAVDGVQIIKGTFLEADPVLYVPILRKSVEYLTHSLANITEEHYRSLLELFDLQTGKELCLPYGVRAVRTYEGIRLFLAEEIQEIPRTEITGAGEYRFGKSVFRISIEEWDAHKMFSIKSYTKCFDYDKISKSICLRTRRTGDYLEINKDHGRKLLQDYLINEKVPKKDRDQVVLLADGSHILWVVGKRISEYYKVNEKTRKILKVQLCGGNEDEFYN